MGDELSTEQIEQYKTGYTEEGGAFDFKLVCEHEKEIENVRGIIKRAGDDALSAKWVDAACKMGRLDICKLLAEAGADFTGKVHDEGKEADFTPLMRAMEQSEVALLEWLVDVHGVELSLDKD